MKDKEKQMFENVKVRSYKKSKEILNALKQDKRDFEDVKPNIDNSKEKEIVKKVFDKEKQIEEMARVIIDNGWEKIKKVEALVCATELINLGYRKLPKDSVIISKERFEALETIENYHIKSCGKDSVVLSREEYERLKHYEWRVTSGVCMTQKEWFDFCNEDSNRRTCLRIEEREKERKETAEQFLQLAYDRSLEKSFIKKVEELAKSLGVEIKE